MPERVIMKNPVQVSTNNACVLGGTPVEGEFFRVPGPVDSGKRSRAFKVFCLPNMDLVPLHSRRQQFFAEEFGNDQFACSFSSRFFAIHLRPDRKQPKALLCSASFDSVRVVNRSAKHLHTAADSYDESALRLQYSRSSGPGGQNVNKTSSKATLHWDALRSASLPDDVAAIR